MRPGSRALAAISAAGVVALAAGLLVGLTRSASAQVPGAATPAVAVGGPAAVPLARFFGSVTSAGAPVAAGATIVATIGSANCGTTATTSSGTYQIDVQALPGCTPGSTVTFTINGQKADQTGAVPAVSGAVQLNLTVSPATPTPAPAVATPPPPPAAPTVRPSPPPAPPTVAPTAVVPSRPPTTGLGGTSQQKPSAPVAQKPSAPVAQRPAAAGAAPAAAPARPALPNTGTGGLLAVGDAARPSGWLILAATVAFVGCGAAGLSARRK